MKRVAKTARAQRQVALIAAMSSLFSTQSPAAQQGQFEYQKSLSSYVIKGWIEGPDSVFCGWTNKKEFGDPGYISVYEHIYWLNGVSHNSIDFDVATNYKDDTSVSVEILLDGKLAAKYPEKIDIVRGMASSGSDLCDDDLGGFCPDKQSARVMRDLIPRLDRAKVLLFRILDGKSAEQREISLGDFEGVHQAIDACIGNLLSRVPHN